MSFITKKIAASYVGIIDIGTYKIRVGICEIFNNEVKLIGYGEKKQNKNDVLLQEIIDIKGVCENIQYAFEKAEKQAQREVNDCIIHIPVSDIFFETSIMNFYRDFPGQPISIQEQYNIFQDLETKIFRSQYRHIKSISGYNKNELQLILSKISKVYVEENAQKSILYKVGKYVTLSTVNIFVPEKILQKKKKISQYLKKNIVQIIPSEFAMLELFPEQKDIVIIDIGNSHTSIMIKKNGEFFGVRKVIFGMSDFVKQVQKTNKITKNMIISQIDDTTLFTQEKIDFIEVFEDIIIPVLEDMLGNEVCPNQFFMVGGGANNFIKSHLETLEFNKYRIRMVKKLQFINPKIDFFENMVVVDTKSNINIFALIKATLGFIKKEKNKMERVIQQIIKELI